MILNCFFDRLCVIATSSGACSISAFLFLNLGQLSLLSFIFQQFLLASQTFIAVDFKLSECLNIRTQLILNLLKPTNASFLNLPLLAMTSHFRLKQEKIHCTIFF